MCDLRIWTAPGPFSAGAAVKWREDGYVLAVWRWTVAIYRRACRA